MWHVGSKTAPGNVAIGHWPTHALLIVQYAACLYATLNEVFATRANAVRHCAVSLSSVHLFVFSAALTQCLYSVHHVARVVQSFACFALQSLRYFLCIQKMFCISVSHWQCIAMWVVCILQCHITNVTDKVQIAVIAVLLILCVGICAEKLKHHRYVVNTT